MLELCLFLDLVFFLMFFPGRNSVSFKLISQENFLIRKYKIDIQKDNCMHTRLEFLLAY